MAKLEKSQFTALIRSFLKNTVPNFLHSPSSDIWQGKLEQLRPGILQFTTLSVWIQWLQVHRVTFLCPTKNLLKSNLEKKSFFSSPPFFFQFSQVPQKWLGSTFPPPFWLLDLRKKLQNPECVFMCVDPFTDKERPYLIVKAVVRLSDPAAMDLVLRKRICFNVYKRHSITDKIRRRMGHTSSLTSLALQYEIVSNIPKV